MALLKVLKALKSGADDHKDVSKQLADYDLQIPRILEEIKKRNCRIVGFQMPDGLKRYASYLKEMVESETGATPIFCTEPCFGACDLSISLPELGCDLIVHMGHSKMVEEGKTPVIYIPCFSRRSPKKTLISQIDMIPVQRIGLISSIQHSKDIPAISNLLSARGFEVHIGGPGRRTEQPGQVLGCNFEAAKDIDEKVDAFIYIGGGNFHPLGVALATGKNVYVVDPYSGEIREIESLKKRTLNKRFAQIEHARESKSFGLLVSTKPGQRRMGDALRYREILRSAGYKIMVLSSEHLDPARLVVYDLDAYVNFGCPRMAIEDSELFPKPVLTPPELDILLGRRSWEDYSPDEIA